MSSPFPGMDPYLEGYLWPDVHHSLATRISDQLTPLFWPRYVARIKVQIVSDATPGTEFGVMYPDVKILRTQSPDYRRAGGESGFDVPAATPVTVSIPLPAIEVRIPSVEIRDTAQNQLVTSIEILSPVNKREPGLSKYREKCRRLKEAGIHVLEIDLLRRGQRSLVSPRIPESAYRMTLTRANLHRADVWAIQVRDPLPILPVPLRSPDPDVLLDLGLALRTIYERAAYDLSINYNEPPHPHRCQRKK